MKKIILFVCLLALILFVLVLNSLKNGTLSSLLCATEIKSSGAIYSCVSKGGKWGSSGKAGCRCFEKTKDANKSCTANKDCEGECLAPENSKEGENILGKCSEYSPTFGCHSVVKDGKVMTICLD